MNTLLVFPPGWQPYSPYLALPLLKGYLKSKNINVDIIDSNVEFYDYILSSNKLKESYQICKKEFNKINRDTNEEDNDKYLKLSKCMLFESVIDNIDNAKKCIRGNEFYDLNKKQEAFNIISNAFYLINAANYNMEITFDKINFSYSDQDTREILNCIDNMNNNFLVNYYEEVVQKIIDKNKDFIAISITSNDQIIPGILLAKIIKERCKKVKHISFGGNYITRLAEDWTESHEFFKYIDSIMVYEGELALYSLIKALDGEISFENVPNLYYVENNCLIKNSIKKIDKKEFAIPDFDGFPLEKYFSAEVILPVYSSRSCFNKCAFCTIPYASSNVYRTLDMDYVYKMIDILSNKYNTKYFTFIDETFEIHRMNNFAKKLIINNQQIYWYAETRFSKVITDEVCKNLYKSGCKNIQFGLESYNQNILNKMKKNIKIEWIEPSLINCIKNGIGVHMFFMIGFPGETREEAINTLRFTEDIINKSIYEYNNFNSTRGFGPFNLNKHSYVWENPEEYNIEIIENESNDLTLRCDYKIKEGLTPEEANELIINYRDNPNEDIKRKGYINFFNHLNLDINEEHNFLNEVIADNQDNDKRYKVRFSINTIPNTSKVSLNKNTRFIKVKKDITRANFENKENIILYNILTNKMEQVEVEYYNILKMITKTPISIKEVKNRYSNEFLDKLESMLYYGLIDIDYDINKKLRISDGLLKFNDDVQIINYEGINTIRIFNKNNGSVIRLSNLGYKALQILKNAIHYDRYIKELNQNDIVNNEESILNLLEIAIETDVVNIKI